MLVIKADIHEYVGMSYVDKNILGPLIHMCHCVCDKPVDVLGVGVVYYL